MVTAILPSMTAPREERDAYSGVVDSANNDDAVSSSISSETTITQQSRQQSSARTKGVLSQNSKGPSRIAGFVGLFTGCGALLALGLFLPVPALLRRHGVDPAPAVRYSFYIVGTVALVIAVICMFGLQRFEDRKVRSRNLHHDNEKQRATPLRLLKDALNLGFTNPSLALAYFGGFVARASSVGITLFIPLYVNAYFVSSGQCDESTRTPEAVREHCRRAYILAAQLSGVSQLVALVFAPVFGYLADRFSRFHVPMLIAASIGVIGYFCLAILQSPDFADEGNLWVFAVMAMLGISQIGAIVCSLGLVGRCVLDHLPNDDPLSGDVPIANVESETETSRLLKNASASPPTLEHLKGSIAGIYSFAGGAGILMLTKLGGYLFDVLSPSAPFVMLSIFNGFLLLFGLVCCLRGTIRTR